MRLAALFLFLANAGFAGTSSGFLVDSRCWTSRQNNVTTVQIKRARCATGREGSQGLFVQFDRAGLRRDKKTIK